MYDIAIIGAGICGASIARELSKYTLDVVVIEKANDLASGTTKANSGIVHAGYDPPTGSLMAKYNVAGNAMIKVLCKDLSIPYKQIGSLVLAFTEEDQAHLRMLYERGVANGVPDLALWDREQVLGHECNVNPEVREALYAPTAGVVGPYEFAIGLMDHAVTNGVEVMLRQEVVGIRRSEESFVLELKSGEGKKEVTARYVINAAGLYADDIARMIGETTIHIRANKGQYYLLDKTQGELVSHVIFQCPTKEGKGVLVAPTAHGNLIVGPDAVDIEDKDDVVTDHKAFTFIREKVAKTCPNIYYRDNIRNFAGNRALSDQDDFMIQPSTKYAQFIHVAGIKSPGLSSAPAIAVDVVGMLEASGLTLKPKDDFIATRQIPRLAEMPKEKWQDLVCKNPAYGNVVCRCEKVTEGEIIDAIHSPVPATTVEAIKRRTRAGAGRCQGGFCSPKVVALLARELGVPYEAICLDHEGSYILAGMTPKGGDGHEDTV
ncbi:MAG: NAD(P)/FAD-dependent oxidoreductase [Cellulosilyticaceae bacterium]